jgi:chemotaxis regulatin CheY-phosphate phosphatase CheZ
MSETVKNLNSILVKLKDIDDIFRFGEKIVPIVEGFIGFMNEFVPIIEKINWSIEESRAQIPHAANQINKVSDATELATTEVLDRVDEIAHELSDIEEKINEMIEKRMRVTEITEQLNSAIKGNKEAEKLLEELTEAIDTGLMLETIKNRVQKINVDAYQITMSLQVQDITAQQLAAVNHLIISVQNKLGGLMSMLEDTASDKRSDDMISEKLPDVHFDSRATYDTSTDRQSNVDTIVSNQRTSQEEIDKLFS